MPLSALNSILVQDGLLHVARTKLRTPSDYKERPIVQIDGKASFVIALGPGFFPVNVLNTVKLTPEVCNIFCATANPTQVVISETDRLAGLVDQLLGPGGPPNKQPVNVHELLEYVVRLIEAEGADHVKFERDYDPGLPLIDLDRDQIVQALLNLVRNAVAALEKLGKIKLRSRAVTNFTIGDTRHSVIASIEIEDDGPGIPFDMQDSVFYPLVTSRPEGTGLGLPAAQELLSRHGGLIEFESRPGRTTFFVRIPLDQSGGKK